MPGLNHDNEDRDRGADFRTNGASSLDGKPFDFGDDGRLLVDDDAAAESRSAISTVRS